MKTQFKNTTKKFFLIMLAVILCASTSFVFQPQKAFAGWAFGDYDQDWEDINYTFTNFHYVGYDGNKIIYKSNIAPQSVKNIWSRSWESHEFANYAMSVCGNNVNFFYTRDSGSNWDRGRKIQGTEKKLNTDSTKMQNYYDQFALLSV